MYHRLEERIRAHILISWLAPLLVRIVEVETGSTWKQIQREMERLHLEYFSSKNGDLYQRTELTPKQRESFVALGVELPPNIIDNKPKS